MTTIYFVETRKPPPDHDTLIVSECRTAAEAIDLARSLKCCTVWMQWQAAEPGTFVRRQVKLAEEAA